MGAGKAGWWLIVVGVLLPAPGASAQDENPYGEDRAEADVPGDAAGGGSAMTFDEALHALYAPRPEERTAAVRRLAELGDRAALPSLREVVRQDPDASVRAAAVSALTRIGGADVLDTLGEVAVEDTSSRVRDAAAGAIRGLGGAAPAPATIPPPPAAASAPPEGAAVADETKINFESADGNPVLVERLVAHLSGWAYGPEGGAVVGGSATTTVCLTPCWTTVPQGVHTFIAGGHDFRVSVRGEEQTWRVEGNNKAGIWFGSIATIGGFALATLGAIMLGILWEDDDMVTMNGAFIGSGLGLAALGLPLWILSYGSAMEVVGPTGAAAASPIASRRMFAPGILAVRTATGEPAWGVSLAMTL